MVRSHKDDNDTEVLDEYDFSQGERGRYVGRTSKYVNVRQRLVMGEVLSSAEIYKEFDSEWVLVGDPETDEALNVKSGKILWHSKDRDEVYRKARELRPKRSAILYTGKVPKGAVVVL